MELLENIGVFDYPSIDKITTEMATQEELKLIHKESYIRFVKEKCERGYGYLDYGDTPAAPGVYEGAAYRVGGSITAAQLVAEGVYKHSFNLGGGLHHAKPGAASGFCVFNDVAIAVRYLQRKYGYSRIAVVDIDGHHGDGTQQIFYREREVMTISFHRYGEYFYPGTGWYTEIGEGEGKGYSVNVPIYFNVNDSTYLYAFREIVIPLIQAYRPQVIIIEYGADAHKGDPLVGLSLTTRAYREVAEMIHNLSHDFSNSRLIVVGGGGYKPNDVGRIWALGFIIISQVPVESKELRMLMDDEEDMSDSIDPRMVRLVKKISELIFPIHGIPVIK